MTTAPLPKLRDDLVLQAQVTEEGEVVVVKDPVSSEFFRFGAVEYFILRQFDGHTALEEVRQRAATQFSARLDEDTLRHFVAKVRSAGLLEEAVPGRRRAPERRRVRGTLLYLRFPLFDPTPLFDWLSPRVRFFFTRPFVVTSAVLILVAAATLVSNWLVFTQDVSQLYQLSSIPLLVLIVFLLVMAHEFGHGLACRHFGGEVHEIGFLLMYFHPACYCNVSDAWLFPSRARRLWVGFAGPYFELFLWALAVLVWRLTDVASWINHVALVVVATSGIKALLNFNPLIKLDGYYLLSDWVDIPNLRRKAFRYAGDWMKYLTGWGERPGVSATPRERRILASYGMLATVYSFSLLSVVTVEVGGLLIDSAQPAALALLLAVVGTRVRHRTRALLGFSTPDEDDQTPARELVGLPPPRRRDGDAGTSRGKESRTHSSERPRRSSRTGRSNWRRALLASMALALLGALVFARRELRVSGPVSVLPEGNADVRAAVDGIVEAILVNEGDSIAAGAAIARMSDQALLAEREVVGAGIREVNAILQRLRTPAEIQAAQAATARSTDQVTHARARLARIRELFQLQAVTRGELEEAQALATTAEHDLTEAQRRLEMLVTGTRPEEIEAAKARLQGLEARRRHIEDQLSRLDIVSPVTGVVATPSRELRGMMRQFVSKGGLIARVYEFRVVTAHIQVPEGDIGDVRVGQRVELRTRAHPNTTFNGRVIAVGVAAEGLPVGEASKASPGGGGTFIVTTQIPNDDLLLKPGMTGQAKVFCGERRLISLMVRRLARTLKVEVWSWL